MNPAVGGFRRTALAGKGQRAHSVMQRDTHRLRETTVRYGGRAIVTTQDGNAPGEGSQKPGMTEALRHRRVNPDRLVAGFIPVAHGAKSQRAGSNRVINPDGLW